MVVTLLVAFSTLLLAHSFARMRVSLCRRLFRSKFVSIDKSSLRNNKSKPFGIKWSGEPINALGVYYSNDTKLLHENNFIERMDSVKKLVNLWSSRGLTVYGKVTVIKYLIIPKFVYILSLLPAPKEIVQELNRILFKF